ncbi:DedA family protein [Paenibacillus sp. N3.4]|uniref:DedA family protein n=1 Tax=Paenibacillus sp. N3.4 TaxID=2603222 RepID=UPI0011C8AE82|nr:DedA family protein [Paenibacillus sp. N3.4]TXK76971.1 DedA family protein [Paenibacillus sp. N3.4]
MGHSLLLFISHYGYAAVFLLLFVGIVGLPIPVEILLLGAGSIALKTNLHMGGLISFAWLGACLGMTLNYMLGKSIGLKRISRLTKWIHIPESKLEKWADQFRKYGSLLLLVGFYVTGLRHASPFIAGAINMRFGKFMMVTCASALGWILILVMLGQQLGRAWHHMYAHFHQPLWIVVAVLIILGFIGLKKLLRQIQLSS